MNVTSGTRLGPYEIVSRIGAGGMGEVWSARDTRLDRLVAVKILPSDLAHNAQFKLRFDREARTISQLNHPNICTLHDVGEGYLVMELLEGESLAERLEKGPLPIAEVFRYGAQIADALQKAHRAGIIHRDLKPGNIMITRSGAKLLDFGLAKTANAVVSVTDATAQRPLTQEGTILGTFQYMAPEQLEGMEADARTDIFAFGALLYEMATGRRAFQGSTRTSLIAAIVGGSPRPIAEVRPTSPAALDHIIARCLEKAPDDRWQSMHDIGQELLWTAERGTEADLQVRSRSRKGLLSALFLSWLLLGAAAVWYLTRPAPPMTVTTLTAPAGFSFTADIGTVQISPDGRRVTFAADSADGTRLFVRELGAFSARMLPGTEGAIYPFWSPDSSSVGFIANGKLKTIGLDGPPQTIADAPQSRGGAWASDGTIVYNADFRAGLLRVSAEGGTPVVLTRLAPGEISHRWPAILPDGKHVLFLTQRAEGGSQNDPSTIDVISLETGKRQSLVRANSSPLYAPPGYVLFWRGGSLLAQRFDLGSFKLDGGAKVVAEEVAYSATEAVLASVSLNGTLVYQPPGGSAKSLILIADRKGITGTPVATGQIGSIALSNDGSRIAYSVLDQGDDLRVVDLIRGGTARLTLDAADETAPVWSPDDSRIAFASNRRDGGDLYWVAASGGETEQPLLLSPEMTTPTDWSADGSALLLEVNDPKTKADIWVYSFADRRAAPLIRTLFHESAAAFSPDGKWIAYTSDQSGRNEVYVQSRDARGPRWQASNSGGSQPAWRGDGAELFYTSPDSQLFAIPVTGGALLKLGSPAALFAFRDTRFTAPARFSRSYAPSPDGQRFAMLTGTGGGDIPATVVQNWTGLLTKK